jgi:NADH dehydrogenase FAD-containing subunit
VESISKETSHVLVRPTLQIVDARFPNIFAAGDVAASGGPKMARAGYMQAHIVADNILSLIKGAKRLKVYKPMRWLEGSITLTLGKVCLAKWKMYSEDTHSRHQQHVVLYTNESDRREVFFAMNFGRMDMNAKSQWRRLGADASQV